MTPSISTSGRRKRKRLSICYDDLDDLVKFSRAEQVRNSFENFNNDDTPLNWGDVSFLSSVPDEKKQHHGINVQHDDDSPEFDIEGFVVTDAFGNEVHLKAKMIVGKLEKKCLKLIDFHFTF